jgi:hypothetical protein
MSSSLLTRLSYAAAATCAASGILYEVSGPSVLSLGPPRTLVLASSLVGAIALAVAGTWQQGAAEGARGLQLATLTALSGGYVLANVLGTTLTGNAVWRVMYFVGLAVGAVLFVASARALLKDQRSTQKA